MRNKYILIVTFSLLTILSATAAAQKITYAVEPGTDFTKFKTYKWQRADKAVYPAKDLDEMFIRTIEAQMAGKGLTRTESDDADLFVTYQIAVVADMEWSSSQDIIQWGSLAGMNPGISGATINSSNTIQKGSFILDFYDVKAKRRIWVARATKTLADTNDIRKREANTQKAMAKIFKNYPPKAK